MLSEKSLLRLGLGLTLLSLGALSSSLRRLVSAALKRLDPSSLNSCSLD
jgi:hypothetical protein